MVQTGPRTAHLDKQSARKVLHKLNNFVRSARFETLEIEWIHDAFESGLFQQLSQEEQNEYLDTLFQLSQSTLNPKLTARAEAVYRHVRQQMTTQRALVNMMGKQGFRV